MLSGGDSALPVASSVSINARDAAWIVPPVQTCSDRSLHSVDLLVRQPEQSLVEGGEGLPLVAVTEELGQRELTRERRQSVDADDVLGAEEVLMHDKARPRAGGPRVRHGHVDLGHICGGAAVQFDGGGSGQDTMVADRQDSRGRPRSQVESRVRADEDTAPRLVQHAVGDRRLQLAFAHHGSKVSAPGGAGE